VDRVELLECSKYNEAKAVIYGLGSGMLLSANVFIGSGDVARVWTGTAFAEKGRSEDISVEIGGCSGIEESGCRSVDLFVDARRELQRV
jgi:hypothetical protein